MKRHLNSRNPALNVPRRNESVATDTIFSDRPAADRGVKQAQVFLGRHSLVANVYPIKSGKQILNALEDNIRQRGAKDKLLRDSAKTEISKKGMDIYGHNICPTGILNHTIKIRTHLSVGTEQLCPGPTQS